MRALNVGEQVRDDEHPAAPDLAATQGTRCGKLADSDRVRVQDQCGLINVGGEWPAHAAALAQSCCKCST